MIYILVGILMFIAGILIGTVISMLAEKKYEGGELYIYPDDQGKMCTVASFTPETVKRLINDPDYTMIFLNVKHLDVSTRNNISFYNERRTN